MPSVLVPTVDMLAFLGDAPTVTAEQDVLEALVSQVETLFLRQCGRVHRPFAAAQAGRTEVHDGTGTAVLWLDRPVGTLTSVKLGQDFTDPDETLDVSDKAVLAWLAGSARLTRRDGGTFAAYGEAQQVQVVYDAQADLPEDAALAVMHVTATIWRQRGTEDVSSERVGPYDSTYAVIAKADPLWQMAVAQHAEVHV